MFAGRNLGHTVHNTLQLTQGLLMVADLLLEAAALMFIGMVAVFTFLFLLVVLLRLMSHTVQRYFPVKQAEKSTKLETASSQTVSPAVVAAIGAAVHQYRQQQ